MRGETVVRKFQFGRRVQNWHRPLAENELRRRYVRERDRDPELVLRGQSILVPPSSSREICEEEHDDECPLCHWSLQAWLEGDDRDLHRFELDQLLARVLDQPRRLLERQGDPWSVAVDSGAERLAERLEQHVRDLCMLPREKELSLLASICAAIGPRPNLDIVLAAAGNDRTFLRQVLLFAPFWVRRPETWNPNGTTALVDHLFALRPVPVFLHSEWSRDRREGVYRWERFKWLCWFVLLGHGANLQPMGRRFGWHVSRELVPLLYQAPAELWPAAACTFAETLRLGGTARDFWRIYRDPRYDFDPTEISDATSQFAYDALRWLVAHGSKLTDVESERVLEWAEQKCDRLFTPASDVASFWKDRPLGKTLHEALDHRPSKRRGSWYRWERQGWDWSWSPNPDIRWEFRELDSGRELEAEGAAMQHDLTNDYHERRCHADYRAFVSVCRNGERQLTIELDPAARQVIHVRGLQGREPDAIEREAVKVWIEQKVR